MLDFNEKIQGAPMDCQALVNLPSGFQHMLSLRLWTLNRRIASGLASYKPHKHVYFELIVPLKGGYSCVVDGVRYERVEPGSCVLLQPGETHEDFYSEGLEIMGILFSLTDMASARWPGRIVGPDAAPSARVFPIVPEGRAALSLRVLTAALPGHDLEPLEILSMEALSEAFFWSLFLEFPRASLSPEFSKCMGGDEFRIKAIRFFEAMNGPDLDLSLLAEELGVSRRSLDYKFKALFNTSPAKAFMAWRLAKAAALLEAGESVKSAASALGFSDQFHFSKAFKRQFGYPPSSLGR